MITNDERKAAIERAIEDGAIPTDEPLYCMYIDVYCPKCKRDSNYVEQLSIWSHMGETTHGRTNNMECWTCGTNRLQLTAFCVPWDAPLDRLPLGAVPDEYHESE